MCTCVSFNVAVLPLFASAVSQHATCSAAANLCMVFVSHSKESYGILASVPADHSAGNYRTSIAV